MGFKGVDRRKGPDIVVKTFHYLSNITMIIVVVLLILVSFAKPRQATMFDRFAGSSVSGGWDEGKLFFVLIFLMILLVVSSFGLILNATRNHRKKDTYSLSLIIGLFIAILGFLMMILK